MKKHNVLKTRYAVSYSEMVKNQSLDAFSRKDEYFCEECQDAIFGTSSDWAQHKQSHKKEVK